VPYLLPPRTALGGGALLLLHGGAILYLISLDAGAPTDARIPLTLLLLASVLLLAVSVIDTHVAAHRSAGEIATDDTATPRLPMGSWPWWTAAIVDAAHLAGPAVISLTFLLVPTLRQWNGELSSLPLRSLMTLQGVDLFYVGSTIAALLTMEAFSRAVARARQGVRHETETPTAPES
jgi:hypothetical protein